MGSLSVFDEVIKTASGGLAKTNLAKVEAIGEKWEKDRYMTPLSSQMLTDLLEEAINKVAKKQNKLVIFIDDLDRCSPQAALNLLEGIKVFLNLKNCVVVYGMDQRQIEKALIKSLDINGEDTYLKQSESREYLEKICQDIFHLPIPNQQKKSQYFIELLKGLTGYDDTDIVLNNAVKNVCLLYTSPSPRDA